MGNKEQIYELLKDNRLTIKVIANKMDFSGKYPINQARMYVKRLINENKVKELPKDGREIVYTSIKTEQNNESYSLDTKILKKLLKPFAEYGIKTNLEDNEINRIKELYEGINRA